MKIIIKSLKFLIKALLSIVILPFLILIRFLSFFLLIRVGFLYVERIGHLFADLELYLSEKKLGIGPNSIDIFFLSGKPSNSFAIDLAKRNLNTVNGMGFIIDLNNFLPFSEKHSYKPHVIRTSSRDISGTLNKVNPQLKFSPDENKNGEYFLNSIGLKKDQKFVCFIIRDNQYLDTEFPDKDFSYHSYRDSDISKFYPSFHYLLQEGYAIFRMGKHVSSAVEIDHPLFIDYARRNFKSDFLDIWLMANCQFTVSTGTGLDEVTNAFRKPICYVNYLPLVLFNSYNPKTLTTPKTLLDPITKNPLSLEDIIQNYSDLDAYHNKDILYVENSEIEIMDAIKEIKQKIDSNWHLNEEEMMIRNKFLKILKKWKNVHTFHSRNFKNSGNISFTYLKKRKYLFNESI